MKKLKLILLLLLSVFVISACSDSASEPVRVTIDMNEYSFTPASLDLKVGQEVEITLVNNGLLAHEIMFGRTVMMMNKRPSGFQTDMFEAAGTEPEVSMMGAEMMDEHAEEEVHQGFMVALPKGEGQAVMKFKVEPQMVGEWEIGCFEQDGVHYDASMKGVLTVSR